MKKIIKFLFLFLALTFTIKTFGEYVRIPTVTKIQSVSITNTPTGDPIDKVNEIGFRILRSIKLIIEGLAILFIVYIGIQMITSMGTDQEDLTSAKKQIMYTIIGLIFINIPGTIYQSLIGQGNLTSTVGTATWTSGGQNNFFFNVFYFGETINNNIVGFMQVLIFGVAILEIAYAGVKLLISRGRENDIKEAKFNIVYSIFALIFVGFIESWKYFVFSGKISDGTNLFKTMVNLALFFIGPVVILFLTLAGYYYITSNGEEEKTKKAKSIIVNVLIASVLLLATYTFLLDLSDLF